MINMVIQNIAILFLLITHTLSAPSGCIESCTSYLTQYQTSGNFQKHADLSQTASHLQNLDYSKPGTWSEHNDYNVDNGHGKVHEERGQYVEGPKTVRYYKKNYSSYDTWYPVGEEISNFDQNNNRHISNTKDIVNQHTYNQMSNSESIIQQNNYNTIKSQSHIESSHRKPNVQNERLENLGEYSKNSQINQQDISNTQISQEPYHINMQSGNWSTIDSYKTDGGHGRVFEEKGQYVSGAKKIRYYKRNYTSNYSSSDGIPIPDTARNGMQDIQAKIEKFHKEIGKGFDQISQTQTSNIGQTHFNIHDLPTDNIYNKNSDNYRDQYNYRNSLRIHHNEEQQSSDITNEHLPYRNPYQNTYGENSYSMYEKHEGYVKKLQPTNQLINPTSGYTSTLNVGNNDYNRNKFSGSILQHTDNLQKTDILDAHQSRFVQNQMLLDNLRNNAQSQSSIIHSSIPKQVSHYKEHWSSSSHTKQASIPLYSTDILHNNKEHFQYNNDQYNNKYNLNQGIQHDINLNQFTKNDFNSDRNIMSEKLMTSASDLSEIGDTIDCAHNSQHSHDSSQYLKKYKRNVMYNKEDKVQQRVNKHIMDDFNQQTTQNDYFTQQNSRSNNDLSQKLQQSYQPWKSNNANQQLNDFTQQTSETDDLTQQTSGKLEFGQDSQQISQLWKPNNANQQFNDFNQQTSGSKDFTQQISGKIEFDQDSQQSYQSWKPSNINQQLNNFAWQTSGSDDLTQQTFGKIEFGQELQQSGKPNNANQQLNDYIQQSSEIDDLTQQTSGKLEFGKNSEQSHQSWKQNDDNNNKQDYTQQTDNFDDLSQYISKNLELDQQSYQSWKTNNADQQLIHLTQQKDGSENLTEQISGKLEFGQDSQQIYQPWKPNNTNQKFDDLIEQTSESENLTEQISGKLEFDQNLQQAYQPWESNNTNQQLVHHIHQTSESKDLTQQIPGKFEFGQDSQQTYKPWESSNVDQQLVHLTQTNGSEDLTQQTSEKFEFGQDSQQTYQPWKPNDANLDFTEEIDDFTKQSTGKLEFNQFNQESEKDSPLQISVIPEYLGNSHFPKPADKPKPRSRYSRYGSLHNIHNINDEDIINHNNGNTDTSHIYELPPNMDVEIDDNKKNQNTTRNQEKNENIDLSKNLNQHSGSNLYDIEGSNVDQVNWLHKSNDATVGLQWHYTYHPSDQRQFVQQTEQKDKENMQEQSMQSQFFNLEQNLNKETQNKYIMDNSHQQSDWQSQNYKSEQKDKSLRNDYVQNENKFISNEQIKESSQTDVGIFKPEPKLQPRILEVYGGGQYDPTHSDDIYSGVTINPSATLTSTSNTDPWDIREKPEILTTTELVPPLLSVEPLDTNIPTEAPHSSSIWSRISHKIATTIDKAKEKAKNIFG